ncbi:MAG TPA: hypothetical protein VEH06_12825 [Candidatus Bathyarchaeia archaeon]|nr:hypothetical protein [Candidatus Bathyarchaeia archaeon]
MYKHITFLITGAMIVSVVVTVAVYGMNGANAQSTNTTKNITGSNMSKTVNMTAGAANITKSTHHHKSEITRAPGM